MLNLEVVTVLIKSFPRVAVILSKIKLANVYKQRMH